MALKIQCRYAPGPNCEYRLNRPDLGMVGRGYNFLTLIQSVRDYRQANAIPTGLEFEKELEQVVCKQHPDACEGTDLSIPLKPRDLAWKDVVYGTQVMAKFVASGRPLVSEAETTIRSNVCAECPMNVQFSKPCGGVCGVLKDIVTSIVGEENISKDPRLNACFVCGCFLNAAVRLPLDMQIGPLDGETRARFEQVPNCWKKASLLK